MILWTRRLIVDKAKIIKERHVSRPSRQQSSRLKVKSQRKKAEKATASDIDEIIINDPANGNTNGTSCVFPTLEKPIDTVQTPPSGYMSVQS